jgi:hypothetical protein
MCGRIEDALQENETFEFVRIKQKFGDLRAYWEGSVSHETRIRIAEAINLTVARSVCTCEICGAEGRRYVDHGWLATACAEHAKGSPLCDPPGFENIRLVRRTPGTSGVYYARYDRETDTLIEVLPPARETEQ